MPFLILLFYKLFFKYFHREIALSILFLDKENFSIRSFPYDTFNFERINVYLRLAAIYQIVAKLRIRLGL